MRKVGIVVVAIIVLIIIALLVAPAFINVDAFRGRIEAELQQRLGRPITLGQMHLRLLPPRFRADNVTIAEDPHFARGQFAQVQELNVSVKFWPLLHKQVEVNSIELRHPQIELIRNPQGVWNFSTLGQPAGAAPAPTPSQPAPQPPAGKPQPQPSSAPQQPQQQLALDHLQITDGTMALTDLQKHQVRAVYDHINVDLENFAPDRQFKVSASVNLPGGGQQTARLAGKVGPLNAGNFIATPVDATLNLNDVQLSAVKKFLNSAALAGTDAVISGTVGLKNADGKLTSQGALKLDQARVRGVAIGYPIAANYDVADNLNGDVLDIRKADLTLGRTPFSATGTINAQPTPAQLDLQLRASNASIAELARLAAAFGVAFNPGMNVSGMLDADLHARGAASNPALNGNVTAKQVQMSGGSLPQPVKLTDVKLQLTPQQITSNNFSAQTGGTALAVQFGLAQYTTPNPAATATVKTVNAKVGELLDIAKAYGVSAADGMSGSGTVSLDVRASGPVKNLSAMSFNGSGQLANATLKSPSLTQPVSIHSAKLQFTQNSAVLTNLAATIGATNASGMMAVRNFAAPQVQFTLSADKVNIAQLQQITTPPKPAARKTAFNWSVVPQAQAQKGPAASGGPPSMLEKISGTGSVAIGELIYDQLLLTNLRSNVTLAGGLIRMNPVSAQLYGGQQVGTITVDTRVTPAAVVVATKFQHVEANGLLSSVSSLKNTLYGLLAANGDTSFRTTSANDIAKTLTGKLSLNLANGRLAHVDLLNQLAEVGKFALAGKQNPAQPFTNIVQLTGDFNVNDGLAQTNNLQADIEGAKLAAQGAVNLADQSLNMHLTAVLSQALSQKVGGTGIGGYLNTALANKNGELIIPVLVTGTFQNPRVAPDLQKLAQMKMQQVLPSSANPAAGVLGAVLGKKGGQQGGLGGIVGAITGQQNQQQQSPPPNQPVANPQTPPQQQQAQPQQQQQQNAVGSLLQQLLNKKKKKDQQQPPPPPPTPK